MVDAMTADPFAAAQDDVLHAFADGRLTKESAITALGLRDYAQLLLALGEAGLAPPKLPPAEIEAMQDMFVRLLREATEANALHARRP